MRARVATELTDGVVLANAADLLTARPLIEQAAYGVVGGAPFGQLFRAAVLDVHRATFDRDRDTVTLTLADAGTVVAAAVEALQPSVAAEIRDDARITLLREQIDDRAAGLVRLAERIQLLAAILARPRRRPRRRRDRARLRPPPRRRAARARAPPASGSSSSSATRSRAGRCCARSPRRTTARPQPASGTRSWPTCGPPAGSSPAPARWSRPRRRRCSRRWGSSPALRRIAGWATAEPAHPALRVLRAVALIAARRARRHPPGGRGEPDRDDRRRAAHLRGRRRAAAARLPAGGPTRRAARPGATAASRSPRWPRRWSAARSPRSSSAAARASRRPR